MQALGYEDTNKLADGIKASMCKKDGYLLWREFLDFFFSSGGGSSGFGVGVGGERTDWWAQLDSAGR